MNLQHASQVADLAQTIANLIGRQPGDLLTSCRDLPRVHPLHPDYRQTETSLVLSMTLGELSLSEQTVNM